MTLNVIIKNTADWVGYLHTILGAHVNWAFVQMDGPTMQFAVDWRKNKTARQMPWGMHAWNIDWDIDKTVSYLNNFVSAKNGTSLYIIQNTVTMKYWYKPTS